MLGLRQSQRRVSNPAGSQAELLAILLLTTAIVPVAASPALATELLWNGTVSNDWFDGANWGGAAPTTSDDATIDTTSPNTPIISATGAVAIILTVGDSGDGVLAVDGGGGISDAVGFVGQQASSTGTVTVTGTGSTWVNSTTLGIGDSGVGTLTVSDGGAVSSGANGIAIGTAAGGSGTTIVTGSDSTLTSSDLLIVGQFGGGVLTIEDGGSVSSTQGLIGNGSGSTGEVIVSGAGSTWTSSGSFIVGNAGDGTLTVADGGTVSVADTIDVADQTGSTGTVNIGAADGDAAAAAGTLDVSSLQFHDGAGTLVFNHTSNGYTFAPDISGDGLIYQIAGKTILTGDSSGFTGTTFVSGGVLGVTGQFGGNTASVGIGGAAVVSGSGAAWNVTNNFYVGYSGDGTLAIDDGGSVSDAVGFVGSLAGSTGTVTVTGTGSAWVTIGTLSVGHAGEGTLGVDGGGSVSDTTGIVGNIAGSTGTATVTGAGSTWTNSGNFFVGYGSEGALTVDDHAAVTSNYGYLGFGTGSTGMATVTGAGSAWTNSGDFAVGYDGEGILTIADGGAVGATGTVFIARNSDSAGLLNIGAAEGDTVVAPGTLNASAIQFGAGYGVLVFNHTSDSYTFTPGISGFGQIKQIAGTTVLTGDSSGFSGTSIVSGGTLDVNGQLASTLNVFTGGTLKGSGTLGAVTVSGTVAPGNSIGTMTVSSVTFNTGSTYVVEVDSAGNSDLIHSTGTATIDGGTVKVVPYPDFAIGTPYTIVTADGGISGAGFDTASFGASLFVTPSLTSDATHVYVTLDRTTDFATAALTPNQRAAASGIQSVGGGTLYGAIAALGTPSDAQAAFDAISGEIHATAKSALIEGSRFLPDAALARLRETPGTGKALWGHAYGGMTAAAGDGNAAAFNAGSGGLIVGADGMLPNDWRVGILADYGRQGINAPDRASSETVTPFYAGVYGSTEISNLNVRFGGTYGLEWLDTSRSPALSGFSDHLTSSYRASTAQAFGEVAYSVVKGNARFTPFGDLTYTRLATDGFSENGGPAALTGTGDVIDATFTTLGLRAKVDLPLKGALKGHVTGMIGWRHGLFGTMTPQSAQKFSGGSTFTVSGTPMARDSAVISGGLDMQLSQAATIDLKYTGSISGGSQSHDLKATLDVKF